MRSAKAVIGAGYGDEGKGLMTDLLARQGADVAVRTNGGAQAGHTVTLADGRRHVFHHLPSGALAGVPGHLAARFVSNPMLLAGEILAVKALGGETALSADPRGYVTTPYDVMANQMAEEARGGGRHGSCGIGFGETVARNEEGGPPLSVADLYASRGSLARILARIREEWLPARLRKLGADAHGPEWDERIASEAILERFLDDCEAYAAAVSPLEDARVRGMAVMEGAQGLMLDQDYGHFPHVTRSSTGLANMAAFAEEAGICRIEAVYVTRAYATRHGAGPLEHEGTEMPGLRHADPTNAVNAWQGAQRTAPLDLDVLAAAIHHDLSRPRGPEVDARLAVTCLDMAGTDLAAFSGGRPCRAGGGRIIDLAARKTGLEAAFASYGPTASDVADEMRARMTA